MVSLRIIGDGNLLEGVSVRKKKESRKIWKNEEQAAGRREEKERENVDFEP